MPDATMEILRRFYDQRAREEPEHDPEAALRVRKALALAGLRPGERVLDVGAKWGALGVAAREAGHEIDYLGLDLAPENAAKARALGLEVRLSNAEGRLDAEDGAFDCVFCLELMEHLARPLGLLAELRRALAPGGRLVLSVPSPYNWIEVYRELRGRPDPEGHLGSYPTPVVVNLLALCGMRVVRRQGTFIRLPRTLKLLPWNGMMARSRLYLAVVDESAPFAGRAL